MVRRWTESESSVISHCVSSSFGVCVIAPKQVLHPRELFFNQRPPLPGSRDTPPQDSISVSEHNWVVSSLQKNNEGQEYCSSVFSLNAVKTICRENKYTLKQCKGFSYLSVFVLIINFLFFSESGGWKIILKYGVII